jgi:hypothetical protein
MVKVDFYSVESKHTMPFGDYTQHDWEQKAKRRVDSGIDAYDFTVEVATLEDAKYLERVIHFIAEDTYPCNKIATIRWAYIREQEEE